jgi:hypothetical protein
MCPIAARCDDCLPTRHGCGSAVTEKAGLNAPARNAGLISAVFNVFHTGQEKN